MNRIKLFAASMLMAVAAFAQQATIPTVIVYPADSWMQAHGYASTFDNDGETEYMYKYNDAFVNTPEIGRVIKAVQAVLKERGFQHEDLANLLKDMKRERAEEMANAADGEASEKGAMDELMQQARPDIRVDLDYSVQSIGPRKSISGTLTAVDAYTNEQISSVPIISEMSMDPIDLALRKCIAGTCDDFCQQMIDHFADLRDNGRMITVIFRAADGAGINFLRDEIGDDDDTYDEYLYEWMKKHAVNKACKKGRKTNKLVEFKNVRIPFYDEEGEPIEGEDWAKGIRKAFKSETGIKIAKGQGNTLGRVNFLVGVE